VVRLGVKSEAHAVEKTRVAKEGAARRPVGGDEERAFGGVVLAIVGQKSKRKPGQNSNFAPKPGIQLSTLPVQVQKT